MTPDDITAHRDRIRLHMTTLEILTVMSQGNPGALNVMMLLIRDNERIDPRHTLGPFAAITMLDGLGIYGSKIWLLYRDVCGWNLVKLVALLRAKQAGFVPAEIIHQAIHDANECRHEPGKPIVLDLDALLAKVREWLPQFARSDEVPEQ